MRLRKCKVTLVNLELKGRLIVLVILKLSLKNIEHAKELRQINKQLQTAYQDFHFWLLHWISIKQEWKAWLSACWTGITNAQVQKRTAFNCSHMQLISLALYHNWKMETSFGKGKTHQIITFGWGWLQVLALRLLQLVCAEKRQQLNQNTFILLKWKIRDKKINTSNTEWRLP